MAKIGLFDKTPERWFDFDKDTEILIQHVTKEALASLMEKAEKIGKKLGSKTAVIYDVFLGRAAVKGWRKKDDHDHPGLLLPDGSPIAFTAENRDKLMRHCREFSSFVFSTSTTAGGFLEDDPLSSGIDEDLSGLEDLLEVEDTDIKK